jgi:hypothetical protein
MGVSFEMKPSFGMEPDQGLEYPEWQKPYLEALIADDSKLQGLITAAETAIFNRLQAISQSPHKQVEREAIADALRALRVLKRNKLNYPEWETR